MIIKITTKNDTQKVNNDFVRQHIEKLLDYLLNEFSEYCTDGSISSIGAIFYIEETAELEQYRDFGLSSPITKSDFEWMQDIGNGYINSCIVIDNYKTINIFGKKCFFAEYLEG